MASRNTTTWTALAIAAALWAVGAARADTISLRSFTRVAAGAPVTLGDVAELMGPEAEGLRGLVMVQDAGQTGATVLIDLARVREVLEKQPKLNLGRLVVSGGVCTVRMGVLEAASAPGTAANRPTAG